jgi:nuclear pore complex protein Nup133
MSRSQSPDPPGTERTLRSTTRNPRRRQRATDNDTLKTSAPRRKRSKISEDTFAPRASTEIAIVPTAEDDDIIVVNGHDHSNGHRASTASNGNLDMPVRSKKGTIKRTSRPDGATILAQNQCYTVKLLPSTPKELRRPGLEYRGTLGAGNRALAVTHNNAMVWDYTSGSSGSTMRVFDIPFHDKTSDPLPHGALVPSNLSASDSGLVLISATTGKVIFHESIDRAASLGLFQDNRAGVEGTIGTLFSGETVTDIVPADHAGFIIVLSSGRLAQLTLRDSQGKARIFSQFLRIAEANTGGLFGSIKGLWNAGFRKDLCAVHTRPTSVRGQMQVISLTQSAELLLWELEWSGRSEFKSKIDFKEILTAELVSILDAPELASKTDTITALDFAIITKPVPSSNQELSLANAELPLEVFLLVRAGTADMHEYALVELSIIGEEVTIIRTSPLSNYRAPSDLSRAKRPRLLLPKPGHTAYVVFEDAVVLFAAQGVVADTPDAQLRSSLLQADLFEETVHLRSQKDLSVLGSCSEEPRGSHASCIAFVKSFGLVRFSTVDIYGSQTFTRISAKSRIEQAIFYGAIQQENIIDFSRRDHIEQGLEEIEEAALATSDEILRAETSFTTFLSPSPTSMEQHLATKARALKALVSHVAQNYPAISRTTMWRLLANAERIAAAQSLWTAFEEHVAATSQGKRKATLLDELCTWFEADDKFPHRADLANEDPVRRFFIGGLHRLERLMLNVRVLLQSLRSDTSKTPEVVLRLVAQANDTWLRILNAAYAFRTENASSYGIVPDLIEDGLLLDSAAYADAPEFWTSSEKLVDATVTITALSREFANSLFEVPELTEPAVNLVREISQWNPELVELYCTQFRECISWRASRPSEKDREHARRLTVTYDASRYEQLRKLADVGQVSAGMKLAEKLHDIHTLADMVIAEDQYLSDMSLEGLEVAEQVSELEGKIGRYFERYQETWSNLFFDKLFTDASIGKTLQRAQQNWKDALNKYLRASPSRAKLCWINDVTEQDDFSHAAQALAQNADAFESQLWAKKVELSMSKLALLAADEASSDVATTPKKLLSNGSKKHSPPLPQNELVLVELQEKLYRHVLPTVIASIDRQAALEQCMSAFGSHVLSFPSLRQLLENGLDRLLDHKALSVEELIDIFTLMDCINDEDSPDNVLGAEFFLALKALDAAAPRLSENQIENLLKLIWSRCYTFDDWSNLGISAKQSDDERLQILRQTAPWSVYYFAYSAGFFSPSPSSPATSSPSVQALPPSSSLNAFCSPGDLSYRFSDPDLLEPILEDLRAQNEILQSATTDRHLDELISECARDAAAYVSLEAEDRARALEGERALQERFLTGVDGGVTEMSSMMLLGNGGPYSNGYGQNTGLNGYRSVNGNGNGHGHGLTNGFKAGEFLGRQGVDSEMDETD